MTAQPIGRTSAPDRTDRRLTFGDGEQKRRVLELDKVTKTYLSEPPVHALRGVSLARARG